MYENQFLKFTRTIDPQECGMPLPVVFGGAGISFFADVNQRPDTIFTIVDPSGVPFYDKDEKELTGRFRDMDGDYVRSMFGYLPTYQYESGIALFHAQEAMKYVAPDECFRIRIGVPIGTKTEWQSEQYPFKSYQSPESVKNKLNMFGNIGTQEIPTIEVNSIVALNNLSEEDKHFDHLYYVTNTDQYFALVSSTFVNITDQDARIRLFAPPAIPAFEDVIVLKDMTKESLIEHQFIDSKADILTRVSRTPYVKLHITGNYKSFNNTGGQIIAKYIGMNPYDARQMENLMQAARIRGGFDIENVTQRDFRTLVTSGFELNVVETTYKHVFKNEMYYVDSVGDKYIFSDDQVYYVSTHVEYNYFYSNLLRRYENEDGGLSLLSYTCGTETFDLPFTTSRPIRQWLPIMVKDPQPEQKDEVYEKLSGERVVMFATINEKYKCETDYVPYEWHKRIVMALSCDIVKINDQRLTKSDSYEINWDNYSKLECGTKITKAEWKMVANVTSRNSNN